MFDPVLSKSDFAIRFLRGEFGNMSPVWPTVQDAIDSEYPETQLMHIRNRIKGGKTWYNVPKKYLQDVYQNEAMASGLLPSQVYCAAMAPTALTLIQGEVQQADVNDGRYGLELFYSTVKKPMREALAESAAFVYGSAARAILETYLDAPSYDWLNVLLERYPGHVLEFSVYDCCFGTVPNRNTIWWEVRMY